MYLLFARLEVFKAGHTGKGRPLYVPPLSMYVPRTVRSIRKRENLKSRRQAQALSSMLADGIEPSKVDDKEILLFKYYRPSFPVM